MLCLLSGDDYLPPLPGYSLQRAFATWEASGFPTLVEITAAVETAAGETATLSVSQSEAAAASPTLRLCLAPLASLLRDQCAAAPEGGETAPCDAAAAWPMQWALVEQADVME